MTLTKNQWIIVVVVALIVIWYFFIRKKPKTESESGFKTAGSGGRWPCNCFIKNADGTTSYGRYFGQPGGLCDFNTDCVPSKTFKDKAEKINTQKL